MRRIATVLALTTAGPLFALGWRASILANSPATLAFAGGGIGWRPNSALIDVNPAHVWGIRSESFGYGHLRMFGDLGGSVVTWQGRYRGSPTELRLRTLSEDDIELRDEIPTTEPLGLISARLMSAAATRGWEVFGGQLGISLTGAYQRIYHYDALGLWISAGWSRQLTKNLSWGSAVNRVGFGQVLVGSDLVRLPWKVGTGVMMRLSPLIGQLGIDLNYDADIGLGQILAWESGGETLVLQGAVQLAGDEYRLALGLGIELENWSAGYAFSYQNSTLGIPQMFQASRKF